jgi:hypothetical protein
VISNEKNNNLYHTRGCGKVFKTASFCNVKKEEISVKI